MQILTVHCNVMWCVDVNIFFFILEGHNRANVLQIQQQHLVASHWLTKRTIL